jgi:hypothetical protein
MIADLDTLLTALYVELTDRIIPFREPGRRGPGRPPEVTDAELACLAVAQALLRCDDERHWLRAAPRLVGHLFPRLLAQSQYNTRLRQIAPLMEAAPRWMADAAPVPELAPPAGRGRHLDPEEPAWPRTPRRPHPRRTLGPHHPAAPRPQRLHLAQLADRRPRQAIPDRLRPRVTCPHFPINDLADAGRPEELLEVAQQGG